MTEDQLKSYRETLEKEFQNKDLEIETTLSYITIGALGFFLTISEKFVTLQDAKCKFLLIVSLISLASSFFIVLYRKSRTINIDLKLMKFVDNMKPGNSGDDLKLDEVWSEGYTSLKTISKWIYYTLGFGIILQVLYVILNLAHL